MEEHHSTNWIKTINYKTIWRCDIEHKSPERFSDEALLRDHMRKHHIQLLTESQLVGIARRSSIRIPGSKDVCPLCGFDASEAPLLADQTSKLQSPQNKRKRVSKSALQADLDVNIQTKRTKVHFQNQAETSNHELSSSSESDLELTSSPGTDFISPQINTRSQQKRLSRHIATHLTALSFMSLRLKAFQEQCEEGDQGFSTDEQEETNEEGKLEPSGLDTDLEAISLNFSDNSSPLPTLTDQMLEDPNIPRPLTPPKAFENLAATYQEHNVVDGDVVDRDTLNDDSAILKGSSLTAPGFGLFENQPQREKLPSFDGATHDPVSTFIQPIQTKGRNSVWKKNEIRDRAICVLKTLFGNFKCGKPHEVLLKLTEYSDHDLISPKLQFMLSTCSASDVWQEVQCDIIAVYVFAPLIPCQLIYLLTHSAEITLQFLSFPIFVQTFNNILAKGKY